ncbi:MAG: hypothetical protein ABIP94_22325 [Planctomycetota bacterium]
MKPLPQSLTRVHGLLLVRALGALALALLPLRAQVDRYELGLRLRGFERELATATDPGRRAQAFVALDRGVQAFFRLDLAGVAVAVGDACWALRGRTPTPAERWADYLQLRFDARLLATGGAASATLASIAPKQRRDDADEAAGGESAAPDDAVLTMEIDGHAEIKAEFPLAELPKVLALPLASLPAGDHVLRWRVRSGEVELVHREQGLSVAADLDARLQHLEGAVDTAASLAPLEHETLPSLVRTVRGMTRKRGEETILPGARLLAEAEALAALAADERYYGPERRGQFWLKVPTAKGSVVARLCVPATAAAATETLPIVVVLHGAGGSENLFCDGYGDGETVRQCERRGWLLAAPRASGLTGTDVPALVDALALRYPIDRARVLVVGHSMGAIQIVANCQRAPDRYRAVAAISGGGAVREVEGLDRLAFFVAAGSRDFGLAASSALRRQLERRGVAVTWREYEDVEHLAVVQIALPDVFAFFDRALGR